MASTSSRPLEKTSTPGIYRRGNRYVVVYRGPDGKQRKEAAATIAEARTIKAGKRTDIARGEYVEQSRLTLDAYFGEWIAAYQGRTKRGIRAETIKGYGDVMRLHVLPTLGRRRLAEIGPRDVKQLAVKLAGEGLSANTVRLAIAPLKALFATAFEEELIRRNPAANVRLAQPSRATDETVKVKALTRDELRRLLDNVPEESRLLVELLAQTGLRIGELVALRWSDIDFGRQRLHVRRRWYRGTFAAPKSSHGVRVVPLTKAIAQRLWVLRGVEGELVFATRNGTPIQTANFYNRIFKPAARAAGVPWATFHTLRHTCASILFNEGGLNPKQVQAWLGHHAASFTLDTYVHLLEEDVADAPAALDELVGGATTGQPEQPMQAETDAAALAQIAVSTG